MREAKPHLANPEAPTIYEVGAAGFWLQRYRRFDVPYEREIAPWSLPFVDEFDLPL